MTCPIFSGINPQLRASSRELRAGKIKPQGLKPRRTKIYFQTYPSYACSKLVARSVLSLRCRAAYDLDNFFRDLGLARAVHDQRQRIDHVRRVVRCRIHGRHSGGVLGRDRFEQCMVNLEADVLGQNLTEKLVRWLLVYVVHLRGAKLLCRFVDRMRVDGADTYTSGLGCFQHALALFFFRFLGQANVDRADFFDGEQVLDDQALRDHRLEFVVEDVDTVNLVIGVAFDDALGKIRGEVMVDFAENTDVLADDLHAAGTRN